MNNSGQAIRGGIPAWRFGDKQLLTVKKLDITKQSQ